MQRETPPLFTGAVTLRSSSLPVVALQGSLLINSRKPPCRLHSNPPPKTSALLAHSS
ncbi:hypothetical protein FHX76_000051 [Lysinibacter cavernae]|uniref:Uncharacterized protein n=1 Tax=Lysinibacter cavernae TaxID=1640652 RepID=A0A7X5QY95_9MICO|nr:hypothetical protein [Lysinibacter cavernae]